MKEIDKTQKLGRQHRKEREYERKKLNSFGGGGRSAENIKTGFHRYTTIEKELGMD